METKVLNTTKNANATTTWVIDPLHSEVMFKVKHLVISTVTGSFSKFEGTAVTTEDSFENADINFEIDVNSIYTGQEQRDGHLKNGDFFEAETFPKITFQSVSFIKTGAGNYILTGNLTLKGVTKEITLDAEYGGIQKDFHGNIKAGFEVSGIINRKEFGLSYNSLTETGGLALGENVKLSANIQLAKQA
ncbi:MAG TPA: YceI family protein [Chitinophagaceae bacterium]|nr:YceI family protein [Chitinophagaceae bacterium]